MAVAGLGFFVRIVSGAALMFILGNRWRAGNVIGFAIQASQMMTRAQPGASNESSKRGSVGRTTGANQRGCMKPPFSGLDRKSSGWNRSVTVCCAYRIQR